MGKNVSISCSYAFLLQLNSQQSDLSPYYPQLQYGFSRLSFRLTRVNESDLVSDGVGISESKPVNHLIPVYLVLVPGFEPEVGRNESPS